MKDYCRYVDVFQGVDEINLPKPEGLAAAWRLIKGRCGNNTPAAALPFGRLTAGCYSGGYSSGYGRLKYNTHGEIPKLYDRNKFRGMSHLQNDGTGDIDTFYNYAVLSPFIGPLSSAALPRDFDHERACPGYYACRDSFSGAECEVTVTRRAALHRITFPHDEGCISVDFSNDGLYEDGGHLHTQAGRAVLTLISDCEAAACVELHHLPVYFYIRAEGQRTPLRLWADDRERAEKELRLEPGHRFGIVFDAQRNVSVTLGLSPKSMDIARQDALSNPLSFDEARKRAYDQWNEALSRIDAQFEEERDHRIFYSNFYHSLVKPCDFSGESFLYGGGEFVLEFATIWDQYKTQLPLIDSLYPDMARRVVETMLNVAEATRKMPHTLMMCGDYESISTGQARMLAEHAIADAYCRGVEMDKKRALRLMLDDTFVHGRFDLYARDAENARHKAFIIDITDACAACAKMAREMGETEAAERFEQVAALWVNVIDKDTGLLRDGEKFYEGTKWNYSFRLMHDMPARIAMAGGPERFAGLADRFFGFSQDDSACCFEGFNNETDMESPYVYHFAGRHDRLSEVVHAGLTFMFAEGRGGVPGNNDSGGLCSCYLWNALGVFPVSGQDLMVIGSPRVVEATLRLGSGNAFRIKKQGRGIYVKHAALNGRTLDTLCFSVRDFMRGGELVLKMTQDAKEAQLT
ncbi:MAG: glycoside hydrolase family 92 protein [Clostridia bacterium]|nr:glycoside hydrolase family 92 protein [Clostridia bacterium]